MICRTPRFDCNICGRDDEHYTHQCRYQGRFGLAWQFLPKFVRRLLTKPTV